MYKEGEAQRVSNLLKVTHSQLGLQPVSPFVQSPSSFSIALSYRRPALGHVLSGMRELQKTSFQPWRSFISMREKLITPALLTCGLAGRVWCGVRVREVQSLPEQGGLESTQTSVVRTWRERTASQAGHQHKPGKGTASC